MNLQGTKSGRVLQTTEVVGSGGEGCVFGTNDSSRVVKIYHRITPELAAKIEAMVAHPPRDPMRRHRHISIAWPEEPVEEAKGKVIGFIMPRISGGVPLHSLCVSKSRIRIAPGFNYRYLHTAALNVAVALDSIHATDHVVGDIKTVNVLVNEKALISLVDCDSFQIASSRTRRIFPCTVASEGFTPPEILNASGSDSSRREEVHDRFGLAVIVFYLLFGSHPFHSSDSLTADSGGVDRNIRRGAWIFRPDLAINPSLATLPFQTVHPVIQAAFRRCFNDGHVEPSRRPSAADWANALRLALDNLAHCADAPSHIFSPTSGACPWCEIRNRIGLELFPSNTVQSGDVSSGQNQPQMCDQGRLTLVQRTIFGMHRARIRKCLQPPRHCAGCGRFLRQDSVRRCSRCQACAHERCLSGGRIQRLGLLRKRRELLCPSCGEHVAYKDYCAL